MGVQVTEQVCLDCGTHEAAGSYCTRCLGRNLEQYKATRGRPASAPESNPKNRQKGQRRYEAAGAAR